MALRTRSRSTPVVKDDSGLTETPIETPTEVVTSLEELEIMEEIIPEEIVAVKEEIIPEEIVEVKEEIIPEEPKVTETIPSIEEEPPIFSNVIDINLARLTSDVKAPSQNSNAYFDIAANFSASSHVMVIKKDGSRESRPVVNLSANYRGIILNSHEKALIPTGLVMGLPVNCKILIYPKSGISFNQGLRLCSGVDIIGSDYKDPLFISIINDSETRQPIKTADKIAQAEVVPCFVPNFNVMN